MKIFKRIFLVILVIVLVVISYITFRGYRLYQEAITEISLEDRIFKVQSDENFVTISELPKYYINAVVAVEDHRFYSHSGVDIISTMRAFIKNIQLQELAEGGSSITQQVAKNLCFSQKKTFYRKVAELFVVHKLEKYYSKEEILELYINNIYYGNGYYNIYDASMGYFNKKPSDLTLDEATLLAGVPNAPSRYAPTVNLSLAKERQSQVLDAMVKYNYLSQEEADKVKSM